jgi:hypothetical protein
VLYRKIQKPTISSEKKKRERRRSKDDIVRMH